MKNTHVKIVDKLITVHDIINANFAATYNLKTWHFHKNARKAGK